VVLSGAVLVGLALLLPTAAAATGLPAGASPRESQPLLVTDPGHTTPIAVTPIRTFPFHPADLALLAIGSGVLVSLATGALWALRSRPASVLIAVSPALLPVSRASPRAGLAGSNGRIHR